MEGEGEDEALATFFILTKSGVKGRVSYPTIGLEAGFFLAFLIVTFSNLIESKGRVDGERGDLADKIERDFISAGSEKAGEFRGLLGCQSVGTGSPM